MLGGSLSVHYDVYAASLQSDYTTTDERNPNRDIIDVEERASLKWPGRERRLSTEEVVRVAAAHFIRLSDLIASDDGRREQSLPLGLSHPSLTSEEIRNVELACHLIAAAEKVGDLQFERARSLLAQCFLLSSPEGTPIQRVVYCFAEALEERIGRRDQAGPFPEGSIKETETMTAQDVVRAKLSNHPVHLISYNGLPFTQAIQSISVGAIIDSMASAKSIHIVDLSIKHGLQWRILMQALATRYTCPVASLKITAVGESKEVLAPIGRSLSAFAEVLGLPFKFRTVVVRDLKDLRADMFDQEDGESVGVLSHLALNSLIVRPESLDRVMRVVCSLQPRIMAVMDVEAKFNSQSFLNRFTEALFYYSAYFDCLHHLMENCGANRMVIEGVFSKGIRSILATEGKERVIRGVGVEVWRSFFARFGLEEVELSSTSRASCLINQFVRDGSCTLERNGKSALVGWKGTPLHFVSAWKFQ